MTKTPKSCPNILRKCTSYNWWNYHQDSDSKQHLNPAVEYLSLDIVIFCIFYNCGAQNCMQYWRWGCTDAKYRRITSSDRLAMLSLMHSKIQFAFLAARARSWLTWGLLSTRTPGSLSAELLSSPLSPRLYLYQHYCIPGAAPRIFLCWTPCRCWWPHAPIYVDPSARPLIPPRGQQHLPI